jgi:hypothetical protein
VAYGDDWERDFHERMQRWARRRWWREWLATALTLALAGAACLAPSASALEVTLNYKVRIANNTGQNGKPAYKLRLVGAPTIGPVAPATLVPKWGVSLAAEVPGGGTPPVATFTAVKPNSIGLPTNPPSKEYPPFGYVKFTYDVLNAAGNRVGDWTVTFKVNAINLSQNGAIIVLPRFYEYKSDYDHAGWGAGFSGQVGPTTTDGELYGRFQQPTRLSSAPSLAIETPNLDFGDVTAGDVWSQILTVTNTGKHATSPLDAAELDAHARNAGFVIAPGGDHCHGKVLEPEGGMCHIHIEVLPTHTGSGAGAVSISADDGGTATSHLHEHAV